MKLFHLSDLHIGRRIGEISLYEDQKYIIDQILAYAETELPDGVLIAGDVYDKSIPSVDAVDLLDYFITELISRRLPVFMVSGNHDSPQRLNFGSRILDKSGIHIAGVFDGKPVKKTLADDFGEVDIYMLPYLKPALVRPHFSNEIVTYEDALRTVIDSIGIDINRRNILVAHQFVTSGSSQPELSDSESISVGGLDNIDSSVFDRFDYVALGHIHKPQFINNEKIRYSGSPLKYSFSESLHDKSITVIELGKKHDLQIRTLPLVPLRDMRKIKGPVAELVRVGLEDPAGQNDFIHATVTDESEIYDALGRLRTVYPNILRIEFENERTVQTGSRTSASGSIEQKSPMELFEEFFGVQNDAELTDKQKRVMESVFDKAGGIVQ